jgi:hypothetical protein
VQVPSPVAAFDRHVGKETVAKEPRPASVYLHQFYDRQREIFSYFSSDDRNRLPIAAFIERCAESGLMGDELKLVRRCEIGERRHGAMQLTSAGSR